MKLLRDLLLATLAVCALYYGGHAYGGPATSGDGGGAGLVFIAVLIGLYLIPSIVAYKRAHLSFGAIAAFNILLGWTFVGWVFALVWSLTGNTKLNAERYSRPISDA